MSFNFSCQNRTKFIWTNLDVLVNYIFNFIGGVGRYTHQ